MAETEATAQPVKHLPLPVLTKTILRGLLIQAAWNYENFQGIGFAFSLIPFSRASGFSPEELGAFVKRHLGCYNTNPYFSGLIVGEVLRLEEERRRGSATEEQIESIKTELAGALGALGDSLIWGALRPLAGLLAVFTALIAETAAPLVFLLLFNSLALWLRIAGVRNGYAYGPDLLAYLRDVDFQKKIHWMNALILFSLGALLPLWIAHAVPRLGAARVGLLGFAVLLVWAMWEAQRREVSLPVQVGALLLLSQLLVHVGWISF